MEKDQNENIEKNEEAVSKDKKASDDNNDNEEKLEIKSLDEKILELFSFALIAFLFFRHFIVCDLCFGRTKSSMFLLAGMS